MRSFLQRYAGQVLGVVSGFDRLRFRGTFRQIAYCQGFDKALTTLGILLKDFGAFVQQTSARLKESVEKVADRAGLKVEYLSSPQIDKEKLVDKRIANQQIGRGGVLAVFSAVELCRSYEVRGNRQTKQLELRSAARKCLHHYVYLHDSMFGRVHVRMQSWFPFNVHILINGREWLGRRLDAAGVKYERRDNCFPWIEDFARAQRFLQQQVAIHWRKHLDRLLRRANPLLMKVLLPWELTPYWSLEESEWATDVAFRSSTMLEALFPSLLRFTMGRYDCREVMRFLGKRLPGFQGEVISNVVRRPEGLRIKHQVNRNAIKMYNKQGSVLRVETTINDARDLKTFRAKEGDPDGPKTHRRLRKGVADIRRRTELCQAANARYLDRLAVDPATPLKNVADALAQPVLQATRRHRALHPLDQDAALLAAIAQPEYLIKGFRNADIRNRLFGLDPQDKSERRRRSAKISRLLALARAHSLIKKTPHTHRYLLTANAQRTIPALLAARQASLEQLAQAA